MKKYFFIFIIAIALSFIMLPTMDFEEENRSNNLTIDTFGSISDPEENPLITEDGDGNGESEILKGFKLRMEEGLDTPIFEHQEDTKTDTFKKKDPSVFVKPIPNAKGIPNIGPIPKAKKEDLKIVPLPHIYEEESNISGSIGGL